MEALLSLRPGQTPAAIAALLRRHGLRAAPLHPGSTDPLLAGWYRLEGDEAAVARAMPELQRHPAVDAAYLKPAGEPPG